VGRKILFITTDQQRYDALGCNGGTVARTPVVDGLAASGFNYRRAMNQNVVCMPARSTIITGQYVRTHGVYANGVPLPDDAPSIAAYLNDNGYRTALLGKAHFEPGFDLEGRWPENRLAREGSTGPHRGFEHLELAMHGPLPLWHYGAHIHGLPGHQELDFYQLFDGAGGLNNAGGGETDAPQLKVNPIARELYHTDWVAERAITWLDSLDPDEDWFCWLSFPDPHHPWDPPADELKRVNWRDLDLPAGHPGSPEKTRKILKGKPRHWMEFYDGSHPNLEGGPTGFVPAQMTHDQVREVNAFTHVENELIDEAIGRVLQRVEERGWGNDTDVIFTTDHGELQGDFGLLFKGPFHCDALMRLPMVWRPAPSAGVTPGVIEDPVGQLDLAPTFCEIAGLPVPEWVQGKALPKTDGTGRERVITEWDSQFPTEDLHLRSMFRDGWLVTTYRPGGIYDGTEGELYNLTEDPHQWTNLWDDPSLRSFRDDLISDLRDNLPPSHEPRLTVEAPV
jgi:arylsulfatase A-like enzyme